MLNLCGIVVAILKMATGRKFSMSGRFIENVLRSTLSYPNATSNECIQFLNKIFSFQNDRLQIEMSAIFETRIYHQNNNRQVYIMES